MFDENTNNMYGDADEETDSGNNASLSEEDTKILLEKEFDDYYEDRAHKSAGLSTLLLYKRDIFTNSCCKKTKIGINWASVPVSNKKKCLKY